MWALATFTLVAGMVDDFRSRKVHNVLVLALMAISVMISLYFRGAADTFMAVGPLLLALILTLPLFVTGVMGGGDVKLFAVFAFAVDPAAMFWTLVFSFFWGAVFGLTRSALQNQLMSLVRSTYSRLATRQKTQALEIHKIPYTFALLLGWFTHLTQLRAGGLL